MVAVIPIFAGGKFVSNESCFFIAETSGSICGCAPSIMRPTLLR